MAHIMNTVSPDLENFRVPVDLQLKVRPSTPTSAYMHQLRDKKRIPLRLTKRGYKNDPHRVVLPNSREGIKVYAALCRQAQYVKREIHDITRLHTRGLLAATKARSLTRQCFFGMLVQPYRVVAQIMSGSNYKLNRPPGVLGTLYNLYRKSLALFHLGRLNEGQI